VLEVGAWPAAAETEAEGGVVPEELREAWNERVAIMMVDGGLSDAEAERVAWGRVQREEDK
jgi:hypothetical protein